MPKFKSYDYNQSAMVVINFEEQLQPGTFEYAIHRLITDKLDLSIFYPNYQNDDVGRPGLRSRDSVEDHFVRVLEGHYLQPRNSMVLRNQYFI